METYHDPDDKPENMPIGQQVLIIFALIVFLFLCAFGIIATATLLAQMIWGL